MHTGGPAWGPAWLPESVPVCGLACLPACLTHVCMWPFTQYAHTCALHTYTHQNNSTKSYMPIPVCSCGHTRTHKQARVTCSSGFEMEVPVCVRHSLAVCSWQVSGLRCEAWLREGPGQLAGLVTAKLQNAATRGPSRAAGGRRAGR